MHDPVVHVARDAALEDIFLRVIDPLELDAIPSDEYRRLPFIALEIIDCGKPLVLLFAKIRRLCHFNLPEICSLVVRESSNIDACPRALSKLLIQWCHDRRASVLGTVSVPPSLSERTAVAGRCSVR